MGKYNISILLIKYALCAVMAVFYIICSVMAVLYIICAVMTVLNIMCSNGSFIYTIYMLDLCNV